MLGLRKTARPPTARPPYHPEADHGMESEQAMSDRGMDTATNRAGEQRSGGGVSLHVLPSTEQTGPIRRSRAGRYRAIVLGVIQLLIIAHVIKWLITGVTTTPVEPSEAIAFSEQGVINAGLIMFLIAMASTVLLGRWFCGWACHVVLLQDGCSWLLKRMGLRPKPFRSRLLIFVPLLLALYMFIWPMVYRWGVLPIDGRLEQSLGADHALIEGYREGFAFLGVQVPRPDIPEWRLQSELVREDFWRTFPGVAVAIPFLFICGFATVYFLGAKGFCTYGCPYGGFFAPLDEYAPARIRVNNDCDHSGHCTAVCSSNVRVHEEVATYGMVVDPGCMKCMDCVSVCPNNALSFGWGTPAVLKDKAAQQRAAAPKKVTRRRPPRIRKRYDLTWPEELGCAAVFLGTFVATRGLYGVIPLLMAVGIAGCATFVLWKAWRLVTSPNVSFHRSRLKYHGRWRRAGVVYAGLSGLLLVLLLHSLAVRLVERTATYYDGKVAVGPAAVFSPEPIRDEAVLDAAGTALGLYRLASIPAYGGMGLMSTWQSELDMRMAWLHAVRDEWSAAETALERVVDREDWPRAAGLELARVRLLGGDAASAVAALEEVRGRYPDSAEVYRLLATAHLVAGDLDAAAAAVEAGLEVAPEDRVLRGQRQQIETFRSR